MKPCKVCNLETDCKHREGKPLSEILEKTEAELKCCESEEWLSVDFRIVNGHIEIDGPNAWKFFLHSREELRHRYNAGLRRAVEIVKERSKVFASPEEAGEREWSGLTIEAIEAEMNVETEFQNRINGISYNGD